MLLIVLLRKLLFSSIAMYIMAIFWSLKMWTLYSAYITFRVGICSFTEFTYSRIFLCDNQNIYLGTFVYM